MAGKKRIRLHLLTMAAIERHDIPLIRQKAKELSFICQFSRSDMALTAVTASEAARLLVETTSGGTVSFALTSLEQETIEDVVLSGIEIGIKSKGALGKSLDKFIGTPPWPSIEQTMDIVNIDGGGINTSLNATIVKLGSKLKWDILTKQAESIKDQLFANTRESYLLNLRAKHEELLIVLKELSAKNRELDRANNELLRLSRDLEVMAHERTVTELALKVADNVRNPATVIGGMAYAALQKLPHDFSHRNKLKAIYKEAVKLDKIVHDFDELAKNTGTVFIKKDLREIVTEVIDGTKTIIDRKSLAIKEDFSDQPVMAIVETNTLKVALRHVLKNAMDASPDHGVVTVNVDVWEGAPRIGVTDEGPGFKKEILENLFKKSISTKQSGIGMGLITVKQIMHEHQGDINIQNNPGEGVSVYLFFPAHWKQLAV